jgi:hypothetical protein
LSQVRGKRCLSHPHMQALGHGRLAHAPLPYHTSLSHSIPVQARISQCVQTVSVRTHGYEDDAAAVEVPETTLIGPRHSFDAAAAVAQPTLSSVTSALTSAFADSAMKCGKCGKGLGCVAHTQYALTGRLWYKDDRKGGLFTDGHGRGGSAMRTNHRSTVLLQRLFSSTSSQRIKALHSLAGLFSLRF